MKTITTKPGPAVGPLPAAGGSVPTSRLVRGLEITRPTLWAFLCHLFAFATGVMLLSWPGSAVATDAYDCYDITPDGLPSVDNSPPCAIATCIDGVHIGGGTLKSPAQDDDVLQTGGVHSLSNTKFQRDYVWTLNGTNPKNTAMNVSVPYVNQNGVLTNIAGLISGINGNMVANNSFSSPSVSVLCEALYAGFRYTPSGVPIPPTGGFIYTNLYPPKSDGSYAAGYVCGTDGHVFVGESNQYAALFYFVPKHGQVQNHWEELDLSQATYNLNQANPMLAPHDYGYTVPNTALAFAISGTNVVGVANLQGGGNDCAVCWHVNSSKNGLNDVITLQGPGLNTSARAVSGDLIVGQASGAAQLWYGPYTNFSYVSSQGTTYGDKGLAIQLWSDPTYDKSSSSASCGTGVSKARNEVVGHYWNHDNDTVGKHHACVWNLPGDEGTPPWAQFTTPIDPSDSQPSSIITLLPSMKVDLHQFLAQAPLPPNCTKWASSCALAIDDQGDIVGYANASDGSTHAILWVPRMGLTAVSGHSDCLPGGCCGVTLKWNRYNYGPEIPLVCYYHVYRSTTIDSGYTAIATNIVGEEWYWDDSTLPFTTYYYKIHPADCHDNEYPNLISGEANATTAPAPPANLSAAGGCRQVTLNWTASLGAVIYHVYRSTPSSDFTLIATINDGTAAAYTDQDKKLADNVTYIYKVDAANYASKSCSYSLVTAATRTAPSVYSAEGGYKEVTLKWRWPPFSPSVTGYNVGRATRSGGPYTSLGPVTTQSYTDTGVGIPAGLANNFQYYYVVSANLSPYGISCDSPEVSATTAATAPSALTSKLSKQSIVLHGVLSAGVVTYNVYRRTTSDSETLLETGLLTPDYTDTSSNLVAGMTYYYVVVGVNSDGLEVGSRLEESVVFNNVDIGLRLYDGTDIITIACEPPGTLTSPLRISKNGTNYGILLTETNSPDASKFRIQTSAGVKAWMKQP